MEYESEQLLFSDIPHRFTSLLKLARGNEKIDELSEGQLAIVLYLYIHGQDYFAKHLRILNQDEQDTLFQAYTEGNAKQTIEIIEKDADDVVRGESKLYIQHAQRWIKSGKTAQTPIKEMLGDPDDSVEIRKKISALPIFLKKMFGLIPRELRQVIISDEDLTRYTPFELSSA